MTNKPYTDSLRIRWTKPSKENLTIKDVLPDFIYKQKASGGLGIRAALKWRPGHDEWIVLGILRAYANGMSTIVGLECAENKYTTAGAKTVTLDGIFVNILDAGVSYDAQPEIGRRHMIGDVRRILWACHNLDPRGLPCALDNNNKG